MSVLKPGKMLYRNFGNSGLKVSVISYGNMINHKPQTYDEDKKTILLALQNSINFFDTSELYAKGQAEMQLGKILQDLKVPREEVVIATKVHTAKDGDLNSTQNTNRKHVRESIRKSLQRLRLDYADVVYAHFYDEETPLQETCRAFHEVIDEGQAFYWAVSNWEPEAVFHALEICEKLGLHKPIGVQFQYHMLLRNQIEVDYTSLFSKYRFGLVSWSALAGGFLTGKYIKGIPKEEMTRLNDKSLPFSVDFAKKLYYDQYTTEATRKKLEELSDLAQSLGFKLTHLALAWVVTFTSLDSALIGSRNSAQLADSLKALDLISSWTPELQTKVNKILDNNPEPRINFATWQTQSLVRPNFK